MPVETVPYLGMEVTRWTVGPSTFVASPQRGARLMHWHVQLGDGSIRDVVHWPELKDTDGFEKVRGGNPILFPFCARTFDQGDIHFWRDTAGIRRQMPMHGIARQGRFEIGHVHEAGFTAVFLPSAAEAEIFPYKYRFSVTYRFLALGLSVELTLKNLDRQPVPWCAGHHFYFALPWHEGRQRGDYTIDIPAAKAVRQRADGGLTPTEPPPGPERMDQPALVDRIHHGLRHPTVRFGPADGSESVFIKVGAEPVPPESHTVVTWTLDGAAPYYCVEPWMGPPNSPEHRIGYHLVKPGQSQSFLVDVLLA